MDGENATLWGYAPRGRMQCETRGPWLAQRRCLALATPMGPGFAALRRPGKRLAIHEEACGVFQHTLHALDEGGGVIAIDDAVIERG